MVENMAVIDHAQRTVKLLTIHRPGDEAESDAKRRLDDMEKRLDSPRRHVQVPSAAVDGGSWRSNLTQGSFDAMVDAAHEHILAGDAFQVVLSQRFEKQLRAQPLAVYRQLREINPSPYMFFVSLGGGRHLVGSSPELLVRVSGDRVETRPLAGTRRRGGSGEEDEELERELLADPKERAEHVMLVDLGRNDVGRVAAPGSVRVDKLMAVERYSHVMHISSTVVGRLADGRTSLDALRAAFPAGTVSGAPKIRAMEIIADLEPNRRGAYAGAIGWLGFGGDLDMAITLRTLLVADDVAYVQAGAGIVADSNPEREYRETLEKAGALLEAVASAERS
jgi:anthranilate synthase component 1